VLLSSDRPI
jgi:hypothetical protein